MTISLYTKGLKGKVDDLEKLTKELCGLATYFKNWRWSNKIKDQLEYEAKAQRLEELQKLLSA